MRDNQTMDLWGTFQSQTIMFNIIKVLLAQHMVGSSQVWALIANF